jgi:AraC-like DNA-binding protein
MAAQRFYPCTALREYICAYILNDYDKDAFADDNTCIYPAGSAILCFSLDRPFIFKETSSGRVIKFSRFNFIPQFKQARFYRVIGRPTKVLHIVFKPYGAYRLLGVPQNCSFDEHGTSLSDMLADKVVPLLNQIEDAGDHLDLIMQHVNNWLTGQLVKHGDIDVSRIRRVCTLVEANCGNLSIEQLTQHTGFSKRALEYWFQEQVGLSPKLFSRITRFNSLFELIKSNKVTNWQELVFKYNYFDQAHFIKEFKFFSGNSPTQLSAILPILTIGFEI